MSISRFSSLLAITLFTVAACGSEGPAGEMGDPGPMGTMGNPGAPGQDGEDGTDGTNGTNGSNGSNGSAGLACWDLNGNAACDVAQEDRTGDLACTVADCQGAVGPQGPQGPAGATAGQAAGTALGNALLTLAPDDAALIPGLSVSVTVPGTGQYLALVTTNGSGAIVDTDPTSFAGVTVFVQIDSVTPASGVGIQNMVMANSGTGIDHWSMSFATGILTAGAHTFTAAAANFDTSTSSVEISGSGTVSSGFRGSLSVLLLKL